jgi:hypothetical protein
MELWESAHAMCPQGICFAMLKVVTETLLLYRANPHLTLQVCQPTTHVTPRRFAHPRFTLTSPILTSLLVYTLPPYLCSPVLPKMCLSLVTRLSRASTLSEKDLKELKRTPGGYNRPLVLR